MEIKELKSLAPIFVYVEGFQYSLQSEIAKIFDLYFNKILHKQVKIIDFVNFKKNKDWPRNASITYKTASYLYEWANILEHLPPNFDVYVFVNTPFTLLHYLKVKDAPNLVDICKSMMCKMPSPTIVINHTGYSTDNVFPMWRISRYNYFNSYKKIKPYIKDMFAPSAFLQHYCENRDKHTKFDAPVAEWLKDYYEYKDPVLFVVGLDFMDFESVSDTDITGAKHLKLLEKSDDADMLIDLALKNTKITATQYKEFVDKHFNPLLFPLLEKDLEKKKNWLKRNNKKKELERKKRRVKRKENAKALLEKLEKEIQDDEKEKEKPKKRKTRKKN